MAKWGARAALAFTLTMLAGLLATTLATTASAETTWQEQSYGLEVEAGFAGSGNDIDVTVTGCPAGSYVRLLVDMYPLGDYMMPDSGPLYVTLELPDWLADALPLKVVKAYCFDTNGVAFADIQDGGTPGGGDNGDTGNDGNTGDNGDTGNNGGTTPPDFKDLSLIHI